MRTPSALQNSNQHSLLSGASPVMALNALPRPVLALEHGRQGLLDLPPRQTLGQHGHADQSSNRFGSEKSPAIAFKIPQKLGFSIGVLSACSHSPSQFGSLMQNCRVLHHAGPVSCHWGGSEGGGAHPKIGSWTNNPPSSKSFRSSLYPPCCSPGGCCHFEFSRCATWT